MRAQKIRKRPKFYCIYNYGEAAEVLSRHSDIVAGWVQAGRLTALTDRRPHLMRGVDLQDWLTAGCRQKERLQPGERYCLDCNTPCSSAKGLIETISSHSPLNLCAICLCYG